MKIIGFLMVDSLPMPPVKGGAVENLTQHIINQNELHEQLDVHVFSLSSDDDGCIASSKHVQYHYYKSLGIWRIIAFIIRLVRHIFRHYFNLYVPSLYEIQAKRLFKKLGIKTVVLENCPYSAIYMNKDNYFELILHLHNDYLNCHNKLNDQLIARTQKIIAVSEFIKDRVSEITPPSVPVEVCYNGINLSKFSVAHEREHLDALCKKYNITNEDKVITYIGRLTEGKGVKELVLAFKQLVNKHSNAKLLIIGGISFSDSSRNDFVNELHDISSEISDKVIFTGYIDYNTISEYHQISDVVVVPSLNFESFSLSTLEALASGVPVIVSDAGGILEVVDESCSVVVQRGNKFVDRLSYAIVDICFNDDKLSRMKVPARKRASLFSDAAMYRNFTSIVK